MEREPQARVGVIAVARARRARGRFRDARDLVARQAELAVAGRRQRCRAGRAALPTSTFEPARFAPPARSKQMNGIFVPARSTPQPSRFASTCKSLASCAKAARGFANRLNNPVDSTVAPPVRKPCPMSSRRVMGRRWLSCRCGASGCRSLRLTLMSMVVTSDSKRESLDQHRGAADHGRADGLGDVARASRVVALAAGQGIQ